MPTPENQPGTPGFPGLNDTATSTAALTAAADAQSGAAPQPGTTDGVEAEPDRAPAVDPEPPIETPTPTQAELDDIKRGVLPPDPPAPAKKVRNMKPGRDGASTTRDI